MLVVCLRRLSSAASSCRAFSIYLSIYQAAPPGTRRRTAAGRCLLGLRLGLRLTLAHPNPNADPNPDPGQVLRALKTNKAKAVIVVHNVEKIESENGFANPNPTLPLTLTLTRA